MSGSSGTDDCPRLNQAPAEVLAMDGSRPTPLMPVTPDKLPAIRFHVGDARGWQRTQIMRCICRRE